MGLPTADDNEKAYVDSDISRLAGNFRNKKFYLVHGTADDNVHYQQSLMLAKSLEAADVLFRQQVHPERFFISFFQNSFKILVYQTQIIVNSNPWN